MNKSVTLILFAAVVLLGAFIYFAEMRTDSTIARKVLAQQAFHIRPEQISRVRVQRNGWQLECVRRGTETWDMTEPVADRASGGDIQRFLGNLQYLRKMSPITAEDRAEHKLTLSDYGFDEPQAELALQSDTHTYEYIIGRKAPMGERVYLKERDSELVLPVDNQLLELIPNTVNQWRSRELLRQDSAYVEQISIRRPGGFVQLRRQIGQWLIQQPFRWRAENRVVQTLLDRLQEVRITAFVSDDGGNAVTYGVDDSAVTLSLLLGPDETSSVLKIGRDALEYPGCVYAGWAGQDAVFAVTNGVKQMLESPVNAFRDRSLVNIAPYAVQQVRITGGEQVVEMVRNRDGWQLREPCQEAADRVVVEALIERWCDVQAAAFVADNVTNWAAYGFSAGDLSVELAADLDADPRRSETELHETEYCQLTVCADASDETRMLVRVHGWNSVFAVDSEAFRRVALSELDYRSRTVLTVAPDQILALTFTVGGATTELVRADVSQSFDVRKPVGGVLDDAALQAILRALAQLQVEQFVVKDPESLGRFGLDQPAVSIWMGLTGEGGLARTLLIGRQNADGNYYAMIRGQDVVFELSSVMVDILTHRPVRSEGLIEPQTNEATD